MADNQSVGQISLDITGNEKPLQKKVEGLGEKLKPQMAKLGAAMAAAFSAAALIKFGKESTEAAAQVNAANSQMAQTFGELEGTARSVMQTIAKDSGIMETRLQGVGTSIYAFAKTSGMDSASAMSLMQDALQATADSAAYYDRSLEETAESLKSFLKGNYANDAALGISCTETTRNAVANKLYGKSFKDLSEAQKQLALLQMVKDANKLSGAMGQAAREADGWENVTGNLKESWKQFQAVIGQPILEIATAVVKNLTSALQTLTVYVKSAFQSLSGLLKLDMSGISSAGTAAAESISAVAVNADSSTDNLNAATKAAEKLKKTVAGFDQLNILSSDSSTDNQEDGGSAADQTAAEFDFSSADMQIDNTGKKLDGLKNKLKKLFDSSGLSKAVSSFKKQFDKIDLKQIGKNFHSIFANLKPIAKAGLDGAAKISKSRLAYIGTLFGGVTRTAGNAIQTASGGIAKWLDKDKTRIAGFVSSITDKISSGIDNCTAYAGTMFDTFNGSLERMRSDTENAISGLLSGFSGFAGSVGEVIAGGFEKITKVASEWADDNSEIIGEAFDGTQDIVNNLLSGIGYAFDDLGKKLSSWWNDSGAAATFENICKIFTDIGTAAIRLYNKAIKPAVDKMMQKFGSMWKSASQVFGSVLNFFRAVGDMIVYLWNDQIKPIIDLVVDYIGPVIMGVVDVIIGVLQGMWNTICAIVNGIIEMFTGVIDFFTGVFTGDWEKAWDGIKTFFIGIWDAISGAVQGVIDNIVSVFTGLVEIISGILQLLWARIVQVLEQIWGVFSSVFSAIGEFFKKLWNDIVNLFKGIGKWFGDRFKEAWTGVTNAWNGAVNFFKNVWNGIKNAFSTAKNWLVEQFTAAWNGIQSLFNKGGEIFNGIKDAMGDIFKQAVNGLIDGINWVIAQPINGLNGVLSSLKGVDIAGIKPFDWINTIPVPEIPHLAKGGLVSAPTLAMVGDNRGAAHDPEVVSPLSKLKSMIGGSDPEIIRLLQKIITLLENEESVYQNNFYVDSERIESRLVRIRRRKQRRYGGAV